MLPRSFGWQYVSTSVIAALSTRPLTAWKGILQPGTDVLHLNEPLARPPELFLSPEIDPAPSSVGWRKQKWGRGFSPPGSERTICAEAGPGPGRRRIFLSPANPPAGPESARLSKAITLRARPPRRLWNRRIRPAD